MNVETFKELSKWIIVNNKLLQTLLALQIGEVKASKVYKEIVLDTEREFREVEEENNGK